MRVIGGVARGRALRAPRIPGLRPTSDRVREAVFDILAARDLVEGARVVDLFAGSGALGIEALSRGARSCVFVESDRRAVGAIGENLAAVGFADRPGVRVVRGDVSSFLAATRERFDLALADPPYRFSDWEGVLAQLDAAVAVVEHGAPLPGSGPFHPIREYRYGGTLVTLLSAQMTDEDPA